jgi:hypothetical protein
MDIGSAIDEWRTDKQWIDNFTRDFVTLDNLADGVSNQNSKDAPVIGDVTLPNAVRQIPRESAPNMPTFSVKVNGTKLSVDAIVANYLLRSVVFSEDTFGASTLSTIQTSAQAALTRGFQALRPNTGKIFNEFGTTLDMIHYNDFTVEAGIFEASNSSHYDVRTRVTKGALKNLIDNAKKNPKTKWKVPLLQQLYDSGPQPQDYNRWLSTPRQNASMNGENQYDIITRYGVGPYHTIDVFCPQVTSDFLFRDKSKSKFGYPRVSLLVIDPAPLTPFGLSRARIASPMANYANIYLQATAKMQLLNSDAPVLKRGLFTGPTPLRRGAVWETLDTNADVQIKELSNSTLQQFETVLGFVQQQILTTMGVTGMSSPVQSSQYQNSDAVQAQNKDRSLSSGQVAQIIENTLRQYGMTALDLYISEQVGTTNLIVDDEAKDAINQLNDPMVQVGDDNIVTIDWKKYYDRIHTWTLDVDLSINKDSLDAKKRADLQDTFTVMKQTAGNDPVANAQANALGNELVRDTAPEVSKQVDNTQQPQTIQPVGGAVAQ